MKTRTAVLLLLTGLMVALLIELLLKAGTFPEQLEAVDTAIPIVSMGLVWLFSGQNSS